MHYVDAVADFGRYNIGGSFGGFAGMQEIALRAGAHLPNIGVNATIGKSLNMPGLTTVGFDANASLGHIYLNGFYRSMADYKFGYAAISTKVLGPDRLSFTIQTMPGMENPDLGVSYTLTLDMLPRISNYN